MTWHPSAIVGDLHHRVEVRALYRLVDHTTGHPLPRYSSWTEDEVRAYVRNRYGEHLRATSHDTGAE